MQILLADLENPAHQQAIISLLDMYSRDEFGSGKPLAAETAARLIPGLREARAVCFLAKEEETFVALALCLPSFSSFRARHILNIHDIAVSPMHRGKGIGQALLKAVAEEARRRGCCKVTLEVREDNEVAKAAYLRAGFRATVPETLFWSCELEDRASLVNASG